MKATSALSLAVICLLGIEVYADCLVDLASSHTTRDEITVDCQLNSQQSHYVIVKEVDWEVIWTGTINPAFNSQPLHVTGGGECSGPNITFPPILPTKCFPQFEPKYTKDNGRTFAQE